MGWGFCHSEAGIASGALGRVVSYESHFDRFRAAPRLDVWRESGGPGGGTLFDLGPHLIDQATVLFGNPESVWADVRIDRDCGAVDDAFDVLLKFDKVTALLRSTLTAVTPGPRFVVHGTKGSFVKWGLDPQEDALKAGAKVQGCGVRRGAGIAMGRVARCRRTGAEGEDRGRRLSRPLCQCPRCGAGKREAGGDSGTGVENDAAD